MAKKIWWHMIRGIVLVGAVAAVIWGLSRAQTALLENGIKTTEESLRRSAVACYALEGCYPESLEGLLARSPVQVDRDRYQVYYTAFAPNLFPEITVVAK